MCLPECGLHFPRPAVLSPAHQDLSLPHCLRANLQSWSSLPSLMQGESEFWISSLDCKVKAPSMGRHQVGSCCPWQRCILRATPVCRGVAVPLIRPAISRGRIPGQTLCGPHIPLLAGVGLTPVARRALGVSAAGLAALPGLLEQVSRGRPVTLLLPL